MTLVDVVNEVAFDAGVPSRLRRPYQVLSYVVATDVVREKAASLSWVEFVEWFDSPVVRLLILEYVCDEAAHLTSEAERPVVGDDLTAPGKGVVSGG